MLPVFVSRILKLSPAKYVERRIRLFSSSPSPSLSPHLLMPGDVVEGCKAVNFKLYDPRKGETVKLPEQALPPELCPAQRVGASHGWLALLNKRDLSLHLTNIFNPCVSAPKVIPLPPLDSLPRFLSFTRNEDGSVSNIVPGRSVNLIIPDGRPDEYVVDHVSLSSSPDEDDCIVGVSFWGRAVGFCRLGDSKWTYNEDPRFDRRPSTTNLMYSKRDRVFYRILRAYWLVEVHDLNNPDFVPRRYTYKRPRFQNVPDPLDFKACIYETEYTVETPTGELLVVTRQARRSKKGRGILGDDFKPQDRPFETLRFLVWKLDAKQRIRAYTEEIGDLSLFLGRNEGFCLPASQYPGLKPNSIYFTDDQYCYDVYGGLDMGVYDLSNKVITGICNSESSNVVPSAFWLAPLS